MFFLLLHEYVPHPGLMSSAVNWTTAFSWLCTWRVPDSRPDNTTEDLPCAWVSSMLNLSSRVKYPPAGLVWKYGERSPDLGVVFDIQDYSE
ncbi:hypothetical protein AVEN_63393-1 [Araneus ventricosus]|uniref:Uncharacterized protein n=1 Tax=Araneus ventricosus TaxID=182803 RepID=A0A4Y2PVZ8_ARAVE|nr:hypothetical protein AVEN_37796-1 [Araneus ventricosus]GBN54424.1 hypothetical protein AVEN_63393-1 [Araneus ventricosus]